MISVIQPGSSHLAMGSMGGAGARVPTTFQTNPLGLPMGYHHGQTGQSYGQQLMMAAKAGQQISDLYRRSDSGYTHHVSNSSSYPVAPSTGTYRGTPQALDQNQSASRSLSSYLNHHGSMVASNPVKKPSPRVPEPVAPSKGPTSVIPPRGLMPSSSGKDFSKQLFVDCSIEYELPNAPKIPKNSLPILMIHPGYKPQVPRSTPRVPTGVPTGHPLPPAPQALKKKCRVESSAVSRSASAASCSCHSSNVAVQAPRPVKRSYEAAMGASVNNNYYPKIQHLNPQLQTRQISHQSVPQHAYFETSTSDVSAAKRSRLQMAATRQLYNHQMLQQQQQQHLQQALHQHYQQSYYGNRPQQQQQHLKQQQRDLRISSFQQITPPESLQAFWNQQHQQMTSGAMCRSPCCNTASSGYLAKYSPPMATGATALGLNNNYYPMPPTPMVTNGATPFCLGCAQCQAMMAAHAAQHAASSAAKKSNNNNNNNNMGIMRSL